jgi:hypothetical protein
MYVPFDPQDVLNQGDIIRNVVISYVPEVSNPTFVLGEDVVERDLHQPFDPAEPLTVLSQVLKSHVMVMTQGCDIDNRDHICVARILPFNDGDYPNRQNRQPRFILTNYQRVGPRPTMYYLQEAPDQLPQSIVSFLELHTIRKTPDNFDYLRRNRVLRLMPEAVEDLQFRIAFFFGRFAALTDDYMLTAEEREIARARREE